MMKRPLVVLLFAALVAVLVPATVVAIPSVGEKGNGFSKSDERYLATYVDCWHKLGSECGRNIVDDGLAGGGAPSDARVQESIDTMDRWLHPPKPPEPVATSVSESVAPVGTAPFSVPSTSSGSCPSYMAGEASSPDAVNASSGAAGCYQVLPSTAAAYGSACSDVNATSCVAAICASEGNGAWAASGATPCDYIGRP